MLCAVQKIRIFDTRDRSKPQLAVEAHAADVNVLSWNRLTTFMLASGSDDCSLRVWDLRSLDSHVAAFSHHAKPVTSIEWCPHESSMLATASEVCPCRSCACMNTCMDAQGRTRAWRD